MPPTTSNRKARRGKRNSPSNDEARLTIVKPGTPAAALGGVSRRVDSPISQRRTRRRARPRWPKSPPRFAKVLAFSSSWHVP